MHIVHIETGMKLYGGAEQVLLLMDNLQDRVKNSLIAPKNSAIVKHAKKRGIKCYEVDGAGDLSITFYKQLKKLIRSLKPDLVDIHSRRGGDFIGGLVCYQLNIPAVLHRRVDNKPSVFFVVYQHFFFHQIVCISPAIMRVLGDAGIPSERLALALDGADTSLYQPLSIIENKLKIKQELGIDKDTVVIACIAQLIKRKGHLILFNAVKKMLSEKKYKQLKKYTILCFGVGKLKQSLMRYIDKNNLSQVIQLKGFSSEIPRLLPACDVLVHPATREGLGVSLLQAAACKVPIISTLAGGIPNVFENKTTARLVQPHDVEGLAEALYAYLTNPVEFIGYADRAYTLVINHLTAKKMAQVNMKIYLVLQSKIQKSLDAKRDKLV